MRLINKALELIETVENQRKICRTIGFVPTMGALHLGHIELVKRSAAENDVSVVSIFVNPTQFNDKNDLLKYPRTLEADCKLLEETGNTFVFAPSIEEIYPEPDTRQFEFGNLAQVMEGAFRPGHFNGVAQVVSRLFNLVQPNKAYFGEKDFQQLAIIRELAKQEKRNIQIVACPIVREADGLAMSSRNARLNPSQRQWAVCISQTLFESQSVRKNHTVNSLKSLVVNKLNIIPEMRVEYFDIVDGHTLQSIQNWDDTDYPVGCIAAFIGETRLIDNVKY